MFKNFETVLERLGRILARKYSVNVQFEGNLAYTDGTNIVLPYFENVDEELFRDLNGYLDHEVAHVKFTDFDELKHLKLRFHKELLNAVEDSRIELEMQKVYPGVARHLDPLNAKLRAKMAEKWSEMPAIIRLIIAIRDYMEGKEPRVDADIQRYVDAIKEDAKALAGISSTREVRLKTEEILKKIINERLEEKKESGEGEGKEGEGEEGESKKSKGRGKGKGKRSERGEASSEGSEEGESDSGSSGDLMDEMLADKVGEKSEFDEHVHDVHDLIKEAIDERIGGGDKPKPARSHSYKAEFSATEKVSIPTTTRFDKTTDHTGKGKLSEYARLKRKVQPMVNPIKQQLERVLKVKENARWRTEQERGQINARSLFQVGANKNYRTVFKEFSKTDTKNVAVQILIDMSGSMHGKIETAKMAAIAMAEALQSLDISFEVTGFNSIRDPRVEAFTRSLGSAKRFNRTGERLDLHVFKDFDSRTLTGLEKLHAGHENPDGECLAWAAKRLALRKEKRKILLVLSDGMPSTSDARRDVLCSDLRTKIEQIKKTGMEVIGVGIQTDYVKNYYPDYVVIGDLKELPTKTMTKLSGLIAK